MIVVQTKAELRAALRGRRALAAADPARGHVVGLAPTMGFLHKGHLSLFSAAREANDTVVATIFVNPTQFAPNEDLDVYPRDPEGDERKCRESGVDVLWVPPPGTVYADDHSTRVSVDDVTAELCGVSRPTHFEGVATVVAKLFNVVQPDRAYFGQKDFQQLAMIRRMVRDLDFPIEVVGLPIVREGDGVAMSSRNAYLSEDERAAARGLGAALRATQAAYATGERDVDALLAVLTTDLAAHPLVDLDYAQIVDADSLRDLTGTKIGTTTETRAVLAAVAARIGTTRLIDNHVLRD